MVFESILKLNALLPALVPVFMFIMFNKFKSDEPFFRETFDKEYDYIVGEFKFIPKKEEKIEITEEIRHTQKRSTRFCLRYATGCMNVPCRARSLHCQRYADMLSCSHRAVANLDRVLDLVFPFQPKTF